MSDQNPVRHYKPRFQLFHWIMAFGFIALLLAGQQFNFNLSDAYRIHGLKLHTSLGSLVLVAAVTLVVRRWLLNEPRPDVALPPLKKAAAISVQLMLYSLAILIPVTGLATAYYSELPTLVFGVFDVSQFTADPALYVRLRALHEAGTWLALLLVGSHAGAALYHHFIRKDDVLRAMVTLRPLRKILFRLGNVFKGRSKKSDRTLAVLKENGRG